MKTEMGESIRRGRPFGGTGFLWSKVLSSAVRPRTDLSNERVTVLQMETNVGTLVFINVYMPYHCANNLENHSEDYLDTLAFIDSVVK